MQQSVPVGEEPRHHVVFQNKYVRVIDARVPSGDVTLFHTHDTDNVPVAINGGRMRTELLGGPASESTVETGGVWFAKATYTHKISNIGATPLRFIDAEILAPSGLDASIAPPLDKVGGHKLEIENEKVRVYRVTVGPGETIPMHTHVLPWLDVEVTGGKIAVSPQAQSKQTAEMKPGDFRWHDAGESYSLSNLGNTRYEAIEIEWK
jgi:mannose-6-phosphate isomerase-like protein (cupin superfamily)